MILSSIDFVFWLAAKMVMEKSIFPAVLFAPYFRFYEKSGIKLHHVGNARPVPAAFYQVIKQKR
jgi:hypothetical protein